MEKIHTTKKLPSKSFKYTSIPDVTPEKEEGDGALENKICSASGLKATPYCPAELLTDGDTSNISDSCNIHTQKTQTDDGKTPGKVPEEKPADTNVTTPEGGHNDPNLSDNGL